jgi:hypothetical protein
MIFCYCLPAILPSSRKALKRHSWSSDGHGFLISKVGIYASLARDVDEALVLDLNGNSEPDSRAEYSASFK